MIPRRRKPACVAAAGLLLALACGVPSGWTEDASPMVKKTVNNLTFTVPEDWPIEEKGGVTAPISVEEYVARKLKIIEGKLQMLDQRVSGFDLRLRILEQGGTGGRSGGLRSSNAP